GVFDARLQGPDLDLGDRTQREVKDLPLVEHGGKAGNGQQQRKQIEMGLLHGLPVCLAAPHRVAAAATAPQRGGQYSRRSSSRWRRGDPAPAARDAARRAESGGTFGQEEVSPGSRATAWKAEAATTRTAPWERRATRPGWTP